LRSRSEANSEKMTIMTISLTVMEQLYHTFVFSSKIKLHYMKYNHIIQL